VLLDSRDVDNDSARIVGCASNLPAYLIVTLTLRNGLPSVPMTDTNQIAI
jgi:hypothetical protein